MAEITFTLRYKSYFGENLYIMGDLPELGSSISGLPMRWTDCGWTFTIKTTATRFHYSYYLENQEGEIRKEKDLFRTLELPARKYKHVAVYDVFEEGDGVPRPLLSSAFTKSIMHHQEQEIELKGRAVPMSFNITWPNLPVGQEISIIGNSSAMGNWNEERAVPMRCFRYPQFCTVLDANKIYFPLEYKYIVTNAGESRVLMWENGENHYIPIFSSKADFIVVNDGRPRFPVGDFKGAGVAVPVFSLRSHHSFGVGEFADLKLLAQWAKSTGQRMIQMLPINDTTIYHTWKDSYPYSAISVFALHPMYLNIEDMGYPLPDAEAYRQAKDRLNSEKAVDYEAVNNLKWEIIGQIFAQCKQEFLQSKPFADFFAKNSSWLKPYAVFCYLRDKHATSDYETWGADATYDPKRIDRYCQPSFRDHDKVAIHFFVQYHLDRQLKEAVEYAHSLGVAMKGDIPIGVNRHSVEVWMNTRLFDCNGQAGAPPDYFSKFGQNWGFPIYNWAEMKKDGYSWWCSRLKKMADYFDAYRIDHILGFFRIFRIPADSELGLLGQFAPALALSEDEIKAYGLDLTSDMLEPYIHDDYLQQIFGDKTEAVKQKYLIPLGNHRYRLRPEVDTQRKINQVVPPREKGDEDIRLGLKILTCQVLFVKDCNTPSLLHPRISMGQSFAFKALPALQQELLSRLYNDFFFVRNNDFWGKGALEKLPALIESSDMMVCGEDLGMVPDCVHPVMKQLNILSLEIQRMPKEFGVEFGNLDHVPYMSVCTSSTHDMSTTRQWWEEDHEQTQRYYNNAMHEYGPAPLFCEPWICQRIIEAHLKSNAMWVILPLQDWIGMDGALRNNDTSAERINDPANPDNYWHYRMHIYLEDLIDAVLLNQKILSLVRYYGR